MYHGTTFATARRATQRNASVITLTSDLPAAADTQSWRWYPPLSELRAHYLRDIGFLACLITFVSITIFCIACIAALPPLYKALDTPAKLNGVYWIPQVIGAAGLLIGGVMFMVETQERWWKPALGVLGWHIGAWNIIGAIVSQEVLSRPLAVLADRILHLRRGFCSAQPLESLVQTGRSTSRW